MNGHLKSYLSPICVSSHGTFSRRKRKKKSFFIQSNPTFFEHFFTAMTFSFFFLSFLGALAYLQAFINYSDVIVLAVWSLSSPCCCSNCLLTLRGLPKKRLVGCVSQLLLLLLHTHNRATVTPPDITDITE